MSLLKRIASLVAPIMTRHDWKLPELAEMFPDNPNLLGLNVNRGQKILLRLRPAHAPDTFEDVETSLIGTMLHELTHNVHSAHDQKFYAFLDKLQDEYDTLQTSGYRGSGFESQGQKLNTAKHDAGVPLHVARQRAVEEAEKRRQMQLLLGPHGGKRLGGQKADTKATPRELAARAAERRMRDERQCGHGHGMDVEKEAAKTERDAEVVDLTDEDVVSHEPVAGPSRPSDVTSGSHSDSDSDIELVTAPPVTTRTGAKRKASLTDAATATAEATTKRRPNIASHWTCATCTYADNAPQFLACDICYTERDPSTWSV